MILEQNKHERQSTNRRVREANVALDQALDADPVNESVIEQRINELAAAQAAQMRMRIETEIKIRRELRPEQLAILRRLRLQIRDVMGPQRRNQRRPHRGSPTRLVATDCPAPEIRPRRYIATETHRPSSLRDPVSLSFTFSTSPMLDALRTICA